MPQRSRVTARSGRHWPAMASRPSHGGARSGKHQPHCGRIAGPRPSIGRGRQRRAGQDTPRGADAVSTAGRDASGSGVLRTVSSAVSTSSADRSAGPSDTPAPADSPVPRALALPLLGRAARPGARLGRVRGHRAVALRHPDRACRHRQRRLAAGQRARGWPAPRRIPGRDGRHAARPGPGGAARAASSSSSARWSPGSPRASRSWRSAG